MQHLKLRLLRFIGSGAAALTLLACGGGGSGGTDYGALHGLVATGSALANAQVSAKCLAGPSITGTADAAGIFNLVLTSAHTAPCMLEATGTPAGGSTSVTLHSFANGAGLVNITPVTELVLANALGNTGTPSTAFGSMNATVASQIATQLAAAKTYVQTQITAIVGSYLTADPLTGAFAVGDASDQVLDQLVAAIGAAPGGKTIADLSVAAGSSATLTTVVPAPSTGGTGGGIICNTAHYTAGAVSVPTAGDMASYAKTYSGNTGTFNVGGFTSDGGAASFVLGASGSLTYNGAAQTVNSICKDNTLPMIYVEFNTTGAIDLFADGSFTGNLADASFTGVHSTVSAGAVTPTVSGFAPTTGAVGTTVTISGTDLGHFTPAPVVKFGSTVATVSSATATSIVVTVPAGLAAGSSAITLSNLDGTGVVVVGAFTVSAPGGATGTGATGTAPNGTPNVAIANCTRRIPAGDMVLYTGCSADAVAPFANVTVIDTISGSGKTCTASYANGMLTATDGTLSGSQPMDGTSNASITNYATNNVDSTLQIIQASTIVGSTSPMVRVSWSPAGKPFAIQFGSTSVGGGYQIVTCMTTP